VLFSRLGQTLVDSFTSPSIIAQTQAAAADPAVQANPANAAILQVLQNAQTDPSSLGTALSGDTSFLVGADSRLSLPFVDAWANATSTVFLVCLGVVAVAFILSFFLKATPLRQKSALEEAAADDAAVKAQLAAEEMGALVLPDATTGSVAAQKPAAADPEPAK